MHEDTQTVGKPKTLATMAKNAVANLLRSGVAWIVVLFLPPLLVRTLDKPTYGVWILLLQLATYVTMFDGGIQIAIARFVARADGLQDRKYMARLLSSAGMLLAIASVATVLVTALASWQLNHIFREIPSYIAKSSQQALLVIGVSLALSLPFSVVAGLFVGLQRNEATALAASVGRFAGALGTAWAAYHHQGLFAMAAWVALGNVAQCLIYAIFWKLEEKRGLLHFSHVERGIAQEFLFFCSVMFVTQFSSILVTGMDIPIVAAFDFRSAAYYGVAATLSNFLSVPHSAIVSTLVPVAAGLSANSDPERMGQVLLKTTRFATALLCLITLPLLLLMPLFLGVWVGQDYAVNALRMAEILVIAQFFRLTMLPYAMIGFAAGQQQRMLASPLIEGIVNLLCSLVAVQLIGATGVAWGTLIGGLAGVWAHFAISLRRTDCLRVDSRRLLWEGISKPLLCTLPVLLCALLAVRWISPLLRLPLAGAAEMVLFLLFWNVSFDPGERDQIRGLVRNFLRLPGRLLSTANS